MTQLLVTKAAENDLADMIEFLGEMASPRVAEKYAKSVRSAILRLLDFPRSGSPRPRLGAATRICVILPYVLIYDYRELDDTVIVLRILHGRRDVAAALDKD